MFSIPRLVEKTHLNLSSVFVKCLIVCVFACVELGGGGLLVFRPSQISLNTD